MIRTRSSRFLPLASFAALLAGCDDSPGFRVDVLDRYDSLGHPIERTRDNSATTMTAIVPDGDGVRRVAGTIDANGRVTFGETLPAGPLRIEMVTPPTSALVDPPLTRAYFDVDGASPVRIGESYLGRYVAEPVTSAPPVRFQATLLEPWSYRDSFEVVSHQTNLALDVYANVNLDDVPEDGVQAIDWTIPAGIFSSATGFPIGLPDTALGDDLLVLHRRSGPIELSAVPGDPWSRSWYQHVLGSYDVVGAQLSLDTPAVLAGTIAASPEDEVTVDVRFAEYYGMLAPEASPSTYNAYVQAYYEPGNGREGYDGVYQLFYLQSSTVDDVLVGTQCSEPAQDFGYCDPDACPHGCGQDAARWNPGNFEGTLSYQNPFAFAGAPTLYTGLSYDAWQSHPVTNEARWYTVSTTSNLTFAELGGRPLLPGMSVVTDVRIDGMDASVGSAVTAANERPVLTFAPPAIGSPDRYLVVVYDVERLPTTNGSTSTRTLVARINTRSTTVPLEPEIFQDGHYYVATIFASHDGRQIEKLGDAPTLHSVTSLTVTGFFTR